MNTIDHVQDEPRRLRAPFAPIGTPAGEMRQRPSFSLTRYLSTLRRRKWTILAFVVGAVLLGLLVTLWMTPKYTAVSTLEIQRESGNFTQVEGADDEPTQAIDLEFYETQYGLLEAESLADRVAVDLRVIDDPAFYGMFDFAEAGGWFANGALTSAAPPREERIRTAGDILLDNFELLPVRQSRLVDISFTSPDADFSRRVLRSWNENFILFALERRSDATSYAREFLEDRLTQLRSRIDESERSLVDYATANGIVNLPAEQGEGGSGLGERSLNADFLATLNRELAQATADRVEAQSRASSRGDAVAEALQNDAISSLRQRRGELRVEYARLMEDLTPVHPTAQALRAQIDEINGVIASEESRVARTLQQNYTASRQRETDLRERVGGLKSDLLDLRRRSIQYNIIQREVETNRQLYDALLQRYKEIGVAGGVGVNNISVVVPPALPQEPSSPRLFLNLLLSLLAGLGLGVAVAFLLDQLDERIDNPEDLEDLLGVPLLGTTPLTDGDQTTMAALENRWDPLSEAYLSVRTALSFTTDHGVPRTLALSSTRSGEGKTTTSFALAVSLARTGRRVVLIDGDMRSPSIHGILELPNEEGLSNYLAGAEDVENLLRDTGIDGLSAMSAGPQPPSAPELLSSDRFARLLEALSQQFDHVVVDAPPVLGLADAPLICSAVEGVVFIMEAHGTKKAMARVAVERLRSSDAHLLGALLTKFDAKLAHYGYGYDYGYGYGYGERESAKTGDSG